ncbi:MAG: molybdopterin molybdotransferase MoeA [Planctomycetota bacterium]|jgi:molybdopterin molybdotransferase
MILTFEKAFETVFNSARQLGAERVDIGQAARRILAEDIKSDIDIPPFNKSAMDGFACRRHDLAYELTVIETIPAGRTPKEAIGPNECAKIMTGSMVPQGADCVIMKEYVEVSTENTVRFIGEKTRDNICQKGEDIRAGDVVLHKGTLLKPQHIAVLASVGHIQPLVAKRPRVAVIATGDELVEPASKPGPSQIRNSNRFQLAAQVENMGAVATNYGIAKDTSDDIDSMFKKAFEENDVVIISGGVSVGDYDIVKSILKKNDVKLLFEKVAVKPGRPMVFGISEKAFCFGLPGNPVSTFVMFELLVQPFLYKMMGHDFKPVISHIQLAKTIIRKRTERDSWLPVIFTENDKVARIEYHGSAHINALCEADGLLCLPAGTAEIKEGTIVAVRQI